MTEKFTIGNEKYAIGIMRNDLYSVPEKAIVQEYICNARDSHRVTGNLSKPIDVHLPCEEEPWFSVRDYGPGISPKDIEDIFIKYCVSSKKDSKKETGNFGLGAKSAWSLHREYKVTSITDKKRVYLCSLDNNENELLADGILSLVSEEKTTEPTGCEIHIDIVPENILQNKKKEISKVIDNYLNYYIRTVHYWGIRPQLVGEITTVSFRDCSNLFSGNEWHITGNCYQEGLCAIVDGVIFPIDTTQINKDLIFYSFFTETLALVFDNKSISIAPNREQLGYDKDTIKLINDRMEQVIKELKSYLNEIADESPDHFLAHIRVQKSLKNLGLREVDTSKFNLKWKGEDLNLNNYETRNYYYPNIRTATFEGEKDGEAKIKVAKIWSVCPITAESPIVISEITSKMTKKKIETFFKTRPWYTSFYIVDEEIMNNYVNNNSIVDFMIVARSSEIKAERAKRKKKDKKKVAFDCSSMSYNNQYKRPSFFMKKKKEIDSSSTNYYLLTNYSKIIINGKKTSRTNLNNKLYDSLYERQINCVYFVPEGMEKVAIENNMVKLDSVIQEIYNDKINNDEVKETLFWYCRKKGILTNFNGPHVLFYEIFNKDLKRLVEDSLHLFDSTSLLRQWVEEIMRIDSLIDQYSEELDFVKSSNDFLTINNDIQEIFKVQEFDEIRIVDLYNKCKKMYPLLSFMNLYSMNNNKMVDSFVDYIIMSEEKNKL